MPLCMPLNINVYERGAAGVPTTNYLTDLGGCADSYEQTIGASIGFESMATTLTVTSEEALDWLQNGLMRQVVVWDMDAAEIWEGLITTIEANFGQETRSRSTDDMANSVVVRYTDDIGLAQIWADSLAGSIALYGTKKRVLHRDMGDTGPGPSQTLATSTLNQVGYPVNGYGATVATGGGGPITLRVHASGWYVVLGWLFAAEHASPSPTLADVQVKNLITAYNAENAFLSTDYSQITSNTTPDSENVDKDMTYRHKIETLLSIGDGSSPRQRLCWGIYEDRRFRANTWAGATPGVATYMRHLDESRVRDANENEVPLWLVRPDAIYVVPELLEVVPVSVPNAASQSFVERTTFAMSANARSLRIEGQGGSTIDEILARVI